MQVAWSSELKLRASDQWNREIPIIAQRGKITDRNGVILASNRTSYSVFLRPNAVVNAEYTATILSGIFKIDPNAILEKIKGGKVSEVTIARQTDKESIEKLASYDLAGVYYSRDNSRSYTYGDALCQVLGFTASDGTGVAGLERFYNTILSGTDGEITYSTDIVGIETENSKVLYNEASPGDEIRLTVDIDIQLAAEDAVMAVGSN